MSRRVVITGVGAITPIGNSAEEFWTNAKNGKLGIDFIKSIEVENLDVKIAGEVKDLKIEDYLDKKESWCNGRFGYRRFPYSRK